LLELLVTMAIIALLASLLLPALGKAKDFAYQTDCMNTLKQIGLANHQYANDWNDWFVPVMQGEVSALNTRWRNNESFCSYLFNFKRPASVSVNCWPDRFACRKAALAQASLSKGYVQISHSWGFNSMGVPLDNFCIAYRRSSMNNASSKVMTVDASNWTVSAAHYDLWLSQGENALSTAYRHRGGIDTLLGDAHVQWYGPTSFLSNSVVWNLSN